MHHDRLVQTRGDGRGFWSRCEACFRDNIDILRGNLSRATSLLLVLNTSIFILNGASPHTIAQIRDRMVEKLGLDTVRELSKAAVKAGADKIYAHVRDPRIKCACDETPTVTPEPETTKMNDLRLIAEDAIAEYREKIAANHKDLPQPDSSATRDEWENQHSHSVILERLHTALQEGVTLESPVQLLRPEEFRKMEIFQPRFSGLGVKIENTVAQTIEEEKIRQKNWRNSQES